VLCLEIFLTFFKAWQPRKLFLPRGVQIQPKFSAPAPKDPLARAVEAIMDKPMQANDDVQLVPATQVSVAPKPTTKPSVIAPPTKNPAPVVKPSPIKLSEQLTISDPKPTIPSTVPDDFLDDSSFSEVTFGDNDAPTNDVSAATPAASGVGQIDDLNTRRSGRERKLNR